MLEELGGAATGEITVASRDATLDGVEIREGAYLGLVDDVAVASGPDLDAVLHEVVDRVLAGGQSFLTILTGEDAPALDGSGLRARSAPSRPGGRDPRGRPAALPAASRRSVSEPDAPIRVLLVEDSDVYRDSLVFLLGTRSGIEVVAAVSDGASALRAYREHGPDVVVLDYRLPDVDGATVASDIDGRRGVPERLGGRGRVRCRVERRRRARPQGRGDRRARSRSPCSGREVTQMNLTSENTAIVLDSTSDYPDAPARFPNMRFVPLYVRFGDETYRDYLELGPADFYEKLRASAVTPATAQPTPQDFVTAYEELSGYERIYSLHVTAKLSGTFQSAELAAQEIGGDKVRVVDSKTASLAIAMLAHAIQRRLARGTTDEEISALVDRFYAHCERPLHGRDARVPPARRPDRQGAGDRRIAPESPARARASRTAS